MKKLAIKANKQTNKQTNKKNKKKQKNKQTNKQFLGIGQKYQLTTQERRWIADYIRFEDIEIMEGPQEVFTFQRLRWRSEVHAETYTGTRSSQSFHVAISYISADLAKFYYGNVQKFFLIKTPNLTLRLALVTTFYPRTTSACGVTSLNRHRTYKSGKVVDVTSINHKVIFTPGDNPFVLRVPNKFVH